MKKILAILTVVVAFAVSCSPYHPWEVENFQLGALEKEVEVEYGLGTCEFNVIANVEYDVVIIEGAEWVSFKDTKETIKHCTVEDTKIVFDVAGNLAGKRMAIVELRHGSRIDVLKIKQQGVYEDFLKFHESDMAAYFGTTAESRIKAEGETYAIRLHTTANDHEIKAELIGDDMIENLRVENHVLYFDVYENETGQPRIVDATFYFENGWKERVAVTVRVRQSFN